MRHLLRAVVNQNDPTTLLSRDARLENCCRFYSASPMTDHDGKRLWNDPVTESACKPRRVSCKALARTAMFMLRWSPGTTITLTPPSAMVPQPFVGSS